MTRAAVTLLARRGHRRPEAAAYVGVSVSKFDQMVQDGRMPAAIRVDHMLIWDVRDLDEAFDRLRDDALPVEDDAIWQDVEA